MTPFQSMVDVLSMDIFSTSSSRESRIPLSSMTSQGPAIKPKFGNYPVITWSACRNALE